MILRKYFKSHHTHRESGFTLIELLVVILIIGILAAIAVPMFLNQRSAAAESALRSDMKNLATTMYTFYAQNSIEDAQPENGRSESGAAFNMGWSVVARSGDDVEFSGDPPIGTPPARRIDGNVFLENMEPFTVSDGVAIGVVNLVRSTNDREHGEFCIVGNAVNTDYEITPGLDPAESFDHALFYDASAGGFYERHELPKDDGACSGYSTAP